MRLVGLLFELCNKLIIRVYDTCCQAPIYVENIRHHLQMFAAFEAALLAQSLFVSWCIKVNICSCVACDAGSTHSFKLSASYGSIPRIAMVADKDKNNYIELSSNCWTICCIFWCWAEKPKC